MLFDSPSLRVILATIHLPLMDVRNQLTIGRVFDAIDLGNDACNGLLYRPGTNPCAEAGLAGAALPFRPEWRLVRWKSRSISSICGRCSRLNRESRFATFIRVIYRANMLNH